MIDPSPMAADAVVEHVRGDVIVPLGNGEPVTLLDAIEAHAAELGDVRIHQMHALHDRPYLHGAHPSLRHVSYFLSHVTRPCFHAGTIDLVPNNFSEMRDVLTHATRDPLVIAGASPPDRHGYFSLGVSADYVSSMIGRARIFLEANARHAADLRPQPDPHQPGRRLVTRRLPADRGAARGDVRGGPAHRRAGRRAGTRRGHPAGRHRRDPQRHPGAAP